jgi:hypothetical protein
MKKGSSSAGIVLITIAMSCALSGAQVSPDPAKPQAAAAQASAAPSDTLPPGTLLSVELSKSLDAKKSRPEDKLEAKTAADLLVHGQIVVPRNTKILGHVTEAKAHSKDSPGSEIKLTFDRIQLKGGREIPLQLTIQAIARPLQVPSFGSNVPGNMGDASANPGRMPSAANGQTSAAASTPGAMNPKYPDDLNPPPSTNPDAQSPSTVSPLDATAHGVIGIKGLVLNSSGPISLLSSTSANVHLEGGSQMTLRVQ